jgi:hypothetical protein
VAITLFGESGSEEVNKLLSETFILMRKNMANGSGLNGFNYYDKVAVSWAYRTI